MITIAVLQNVYIITFWELDKKVWRHLRVLSYTIINVVFNTAAPFNL